MYRSGEGTLFYLTKHSRPDITNPVMELSKSMDGASMAHVTGMYRVITTKHPKAQVIPLDRVTHLGRKLHFNLMGWVQAL